jgi:hypothetical protein
MEVQEVTPNVDSGSLPARSSSTPIASWPMGPPSARQAAEKMFAREPRWVEALLTLRNAIGTYQKRNARTWTSAIGRNVLQTLCCAANAAGSCLFRERPGWTDHAACRSMASPRPCCVHSHGWCACAVRVSGGTQSLAVKRISSGLLRCAFSMGCARALKRDRDYVGPW